MSNPVRMPYNLSPRAFFFIIHDSNDMKAEPMRRIGWGADEGSFPHMSTCGCFVIGAKYA